jgi:hypothetical protein
MEDHGFGDWVDRWSRKYQQVGDSRIEKLAGKDAFSAEDVQKVYEWKYRRMWPKRKIEAMRRLPEERVVDLSRRAFLCDDELGALMILTLIPGAGAAGASALLMARDPSRYTVMDVRAINSLIALGFWSENQGTRASCLTWPDYLSVCRNLAALTHRSLRIVDRALWSANGQASPGG